MTIEFEERVSVDLGRLLRGCGATSTSTGIVAWVPHAGDRVEIDATDIRLLQGIGGADWTPLGDIFRQHEVARLQQLHQLGVVVTGDACSGCVRDQQFRDLGWHESAALAHTRSLWSGVSTPERGDADRPSVVARLVERLGPPPTHFPARQDRLRRTALPTRRRSELDELLARRATCRNFSERALAPEQLSQLLGSVFGAQAIEMLAPDAYAIKKNSPSGGALHAIEAYLLVRAVDGCAPGIYHYNVEHHALDQLSEANSEQIRAAADNAVAGQSYFADAAVCIVLAARFERAFWKYRNHPKIYRALQIEAGHLAQNLYLVATDLGLGAFITAAVNERDIDRMLQLDAASEGSLAVCGVGHRSGERKSVEFDPNGCVWAVQPSERTRE